jgi:xylulokinase
MEDVMALLIGLDAGTTTIKAVLYDPAAGQVRRVATRPTPVAHPQTGHSEHDPESLYQAACSCIAEAAGGEAGVVGLAISSMAETGVLLDSHGQPAGPVIAWYDRRSEPQAAWVEAQIPVETLYAITGQRVSPSFGVTKLLWMRENLPAAFARGARWLPIPAYLMWRLTGQAVVDYTIAARTLVFDQNTLDWSPQLLALYDLPRTLFPATAPGGQAAGQISRPAAEECGLPADVICCTGGHDHLCAALATGACASGALTESSGTANALLWLLPRFLPGPGLAERGFASYAYVLPDLYALKGGLKAAGSAVAWLARQLAPAAQGPDYAALEAEAARGVGRKAGPLWLPHLIGSGTPQGDRFSRAALAGVRIEDDRGDLFRGLLESLAFWLRHNVEEMAQISGHASAIPEVLTLTGGGTRLALLSQLKADILNRPVRMPQIPETAAVGAALLAGLGTGVFASPQEAASSPRYACQTFAPDPRRAAWYDPYYRDVYLPLYERLKPIHDALERMNAAQPDR